jgi:hypothetical protein
MNHTPVLARTRDSRFAIQFFLMTFTISWVSAAALVLSTDLQRTAISNFQGLMIFPDSSRATRGRRSIARGGAVMPSRPLAEKLNILGSSSHRDFDALDESIFQLRTGAPSAKRGLHSLPWQAGRQPIAGSRIGTRRRATVSAGSPAARARMLAQSRTRSRVGGVPSGANSLRRANGSHAGYSIFGIGVDRSHNCRADFPQAGVPGARSLRAGVKENPPPRLQQSSHYSRKCLNRP